MRHLGKTETKLAIFDTFKTKENDLTGEAIRQRNILGILASNNNPADRTRTGIAQIIAKEQGISWKNIYSGIFKDFDEVFLPLEIVQEEGRLPLHRGPKALQEKGIPYYNISKKGILICLSIKEIEKRDELFKEFFRDLENEFEQVLESLMKVSPNFAYSIFQKYVKAFCDKEIHDLLPFDLRKLKEISDDSLVIQKEILVAFAKLSKQDREDAIDFLEKIT